MENNAVAGNSHESGLVKKMKQKRRDFIIKVGGMSFPVHKSIISLASGYFEAMLDSGMKEAQQGFVKMCDVQAAAVEQCIEFMYTGQAEINDSNVQSVLQAAHLIQLQEIVDKCFRFLRANLSPQTCIEAIKIAKLYSNEYLEKHAENYLITIFTQVVSTESYPTVSKVDLIRYLKQSSAAHDQKWKAVITWLKVNNSFVDVDIVELMRAIQVTSYPLPFLCEIVWQSSILQGLERGKKLVLDGIFSDLKKLEMNVSLSNFFILKEAARKEKISNVDDVTNILKTFLKKNFEVLSQNERFVEEFSKDEIKEFFSSRDTQAFQKTKLRLALHWARQGIYRQMDFEDLFKEIDLEKIPRNILAPLVADEALIMDSSKCLKKIVNFLLKAKDTVEVMLDALFSEPSIFTLDKGTGVVKGYTLNTGSEYTVSSVRQHGSSDIITLGKRLYLLYDRSIFVLEPDGRWKTVSEGNYIECKQLIFQGKLYIVTGYQWRCFNPENNSWSSGRDKRPSLTETLQQCLMVPTTEYIYVFSQRSGIARFYPTELDSQKEDVQMSSKFRCPQNALLVGHGDSIYIFSKCTHALHRGQNILQRFNCNSKAVENIAMSETVVSRNKFGICAVDGKIYVVGGDQCDAKFTPQDTIEVFNPERNEWKFVRHIYPSTGPLSVCGYTPSSNA